MGATGNGTLELRMPEVEVPASIGAVFGKARSLAITGRADAAGTMRRYVIIVTPGRLLMLQPCPPPGSMPESQVAAIRSVLSPTRPQHVAAIGYTELTALRTNIAQAIPFLGMLLGFAYVGHAVWVFEGHPSALAEGCRAADVLLVDGGMLPFLAPDWHAVASHAMRRPEIYVHDRETFSLSRPAARAA